VSHDETVDEKTELERIARARDLAAGQPAAETAETTEAEAPGDAANTDTEDGKQTPDERLAHYMHDFARVWHDALRTVSKLGEKHDAAILVPTQKPLHPAHRVKHALVGMRVPIEIVVQFLDAYQEKYPDKLEALEKAPPKRKIMIVPSGAMPKQ